MHIPYIINNVPAEEIPIDPANALDLNDVRYSNFLKLRMPHKAVLPYYECSWASSSSSATEPGGYPLPIGCIETVNPLPIFSNDLDEINEIPNDLPGRTGGLDMTGYNYLNMSGVNRDIPGLPDSSSSSS